MDFIPPEPDRKIALSELLLQEVDHSGYLSKRSRHHVEGTFKKKFVAEWSQTYAVIHKGCLYMYKSVNDTKPNQAVSLFGYFRVSLVNEGQAGMLAFELCAAQPTMENFVFSTPAEKDIQIWMQHLSEAVKLANGHKVKNVLTPGKKSPLKKKESVSLINIPSIKKTALESDEDDADDDMEGDLSNYNIARGGGHTDDDEPKDDIDYETTMAVRAMSASANDDDPSSAATLGMLKADDETSDDKDVIKVKGELYAWNAIYWPNDEKKEPTYAFTMLKEKNVEGVFMVRDRSDEKTGLYTLCAWVTTCVRKYRIDEKDSHFSIKKGEMFASIPELVCHYKQNHLPNRPDCYLTQPYTMDWVQEAYEEVPRMTTA